MAKNKETVITRLLHTVSDLRVREDKEGKKRVSYEIVAREIEFISEGKKESGDNKPKGKSETSLDIPD